MKVLTFLSHKIEQELQFIGINMPHAVTCHTTFVVVNI